MKINVIAEIGINHRGSITIARKLIEQAKSAGCWGVKFQYRHLDSFYHSATEIGDGIIIEELERIDLTVSEYISLAVYGHELGLQVGVSFFRIRDFEEFNSALEYFDFFKVPSAECINTPLVNKLLQTNKKVMVSTGGHSLDQIENSLLPLKNSGLIVFHCIANYPAALGCQNLNFLRTLSEMGFKDVGYSSHDEDIEVSLLAMAMGIGWIERHLTEDVSGTGLDDSSSSEIADFYKLTRFSSAMESILGVKNKVLNQGEILNMQNLGTGLYSNKDILKGSSVTLSDFQIKAPRVGLSVGDFLSKYSNRKVTIDIVKGQALEKRSFKIVKKFDKAKLFKFAKLNQIGIPVRLHDFASFKDIVNTGTYEFHLSYQECNHGDLANALSLIEGSDNISIHLPDYIPGNHILDPVSHSSAIKRESRRLISKVTNFAESIRQKTGKEVPIVGSFSQTNDKPKRIILDELFSFLDSGNLSEFKILPQWLPVYAWYFGGAVKLSLFNSLEDIEYIVQNKRSICLDICHLGLSANYAGVDWRDWYQMLVPFNKHTHLADSVGIDGEGLPLGDGDIGDFDQFLLEDGLKIIEVWQGHFNQGEGFLTALDTLAGK